MEERGRKITLDEPVFGEHRPKSHGSAAAVRQADVSATRVGLIKKK
jgi:hypothetical protein